MTTIKTSYNRRSFLKRSGAAGGGLVLGFSFLAGCASDVIEETIEKLELPDQWFDMNAFLKIGNNGVVTILSPNPEIGQNVKTSMPMLIAEELDVNWKKVIVEQAGLDSKNFTRQVAGGSQSIRQGWTSLRTVGATARRMLLEAAAQIHELPINELTTENGYVIHKKSDAKISYGELASEAANQNIPEEVELKDPKDFKIIGQNILNVDGIDLVTGKPLFGMDYTEEGMLIAMIEHAPAFGMKAESFNVDEIKAMSGVTDAFILDTEEFGKNHFGANAFLKNSLVAIIGETTWELMKAKKSLKVNWVQVGAEENSADHMSTLTDLINKKMKATRVDGDPEAAFANAEKVIEREYSAPFVPHNTMAPMNFFADVSEDSARLVGPIQTPDHNANVLSKVLDIPVENISIMMTRMGGGFGRRLYGNFVYEAAIISQKMKKPIKLIYTREDDMAYGNYRPAYKVKYKAGLDKDNKLVAFTVHGAGAHGGPVFENRFPAGAVENYSAVNSTMETNVSTGAWRAPKSNFIAGAEQAFIDEIAEAAGKDPIDFRIELFDIAKNNPTGEENDYDPDRYAGVLKLVREKSNWDQKEEGIHRGVAAYYCHNSYVAQVVDVAIENNKAKIKKVWSAVDCGIVVNPTGAKNQVEGGAIDGIGTAMYGGLHFTNGVPQQTNFDKYQMIRYSDAPPEMETFFVNNGIDPTGLGEPGMPPVIGALANALYQSTGSRIYDQPFAKQNELLG